MNQYRRGRNSKWLSALILLAIAYGSLLYFRHTLTGTHTLDGAVGVILGLYICSHPAANAVDRWLFGRSATRPASSRRDEAVWLALNVLALLAGWLVIVMGAIRLTAKAT